MSLINELIQVLPPCKFERALIKRKQDTTDIVEWILQVHDMYPQDYDLIYKYFDTGDIYTTCKKIWDFEKQNLRYEAESGKVQTSKSPAAILQTTDDCKHYSLFTGGLLAAIKRNQGGKWNWFFRFASDNEVNYVTHVFVVVTNKDKEIWIDPCLSNFDQRKKYLITQDEYPMLYHISGVNDNQGENPKVITVDTKIAWESFLTMVNQNYFSFKDLLRNNPSITNGPVRNWCIKNGYNFQQLTNFLMNGE